MSTPGELNRIPSLVGGVPTKADLAPSIIFSVAFALSLIPWLRRFINHKTRTVTLSIGVFLFSFERIIVYAIRASLAHNHSPGDTLSKGKLTYLQVSFALGYIGFANDCVQFLRAILVNATLEDPVRGSQDDPKTRFWSRRWTDFYGLTFLGATVTGALAYSAFPHSADNLHDANRVFGLRCVLTASYGYGC